jgi:hypothetical protein
MSKYNIKICVLTLLEELEMASFSLFSSVLPHKWKERTFNRP